MKKLTKAFTLVELLVCLLILAIAAAIGFRLFSGVEIGMDGKLNPIIFPREANAQANQELVEQMAEQNRLMRELLNKQNKQ